MDLHALLIVFQLVVLIFAFSVHECAHAWAAMRLGDPTAYMLGRVTLNPIKHLDPWGSVAMPLLSLVLGAPLLGWAKPCPVTLRNFRKVKRDDILTTLAGPASNLLMALLSLLLLIVLKHTPWLGARGVEDAALLAHGIYDQPLAEMPTLFPLAVLLYYGILTNVLLFCFNLIPIPPLDGSRIIRYFLPYSAGQALDRLGTWGTILVFFLGVNFILPIIYPPLQHVFNAALLAL